MQNKMEDPYKYEYPCGLYLVDKLLIKSKLLYIAYCATFSFLEPKCCMKKDSKLTSWIPSLKIRKSDFLSSYIGLFSLLYPRFERDGAIHEMIESML